MEVLNEVSILVHLITPASTSDLHALQLVLHYPVEPFEPFTTAVIITRHF
jgi:hypothetical protein